MEKPGQIQRPRAIEPSAPAFRRRPARIQARHSASRPGRLVGTIDGMRLDVTWGAREAEQHEDRLLVERAIGFGVDELSPASGLADVDVSVAPGSFGKGAAGLGVALVFDVAEHLVNDTASLIALGYALRSCIAKISRRREQKPAGASAESLAALSASEAPSIVDDPDSWRYLRTVPLTTDGSIGTDMRDVWASTFLNEPQGLLQVVFSSATTRQLGTAIVATEWCAGPGGHIRTDAELAQNLRAWFGH